MSDHLQMLIDAARSYTISPEELQAQRRSFAYGNTKIENDLSYAGDGGCAGRTAEYESANV